LVLDCESVEDTPQGKIGEGELQGGIEVETRRKERENNGKE